MTTVNRQTRKRDSLGTLPRRSAQRSPDVVDLEQGPDGVWAETVPLEPLVVEDPLAQDAAATAVEARGETRIAKRRPSSVAIALPALAAPRCLLCGRKATTRARAVIFVADLCKGCKSMGNRIYELLK